MLVSSWRQRWQIANGAKAAGHVTALAVGAELALVHVVFRVTIIARTRQGRTTGCRSLVAADTDQVSVGAVQHEARLSVVIEAPAFPAARVVA